MSPSSSTPSCTTGRLEETGHTNRKLSTTIRVANPIHAVANVDDYSGSARLLAATTLRNVLGTMTLGDILCQRESIAREMKVWKEKQISTLKY